MRLQGRIRQSWSGNNQNFSNMSKKEIIIKWKSVEERTPLFPNGVIYIKEDTSIEYPLSLVSFPLGRHKNGTKKQWENAKLIAAAPELLRACKEALRFVCVEESVYDVLADAIKKATE